MPKKLLSFLGTNAYLHTIYELNNKKSEPVRYIQEALAELICKDWQNDDEIIVFATSGENGSIKKNWESGEISKFDEKAKAIEPEPKGLKNRLEGLNLECKIKMVEIPDGIKDGEIWKIIQKVYDSIKENDEVYFDITHSFRYIPMIIPSLISFLKTTKSINLKAIHYGAFEVLGSPQEITKIDIENRIAPIRELSELYKMIEWAEATNAFINFGSGKSLIEQIDRIDRTNIDKKTKNLFTPLKNNIKKIDNALKYNNLTELKKLKNPDKIYKIDLDKYPNIFALSKLLPQIETFVSKWEDNEVKNGILAAKWHIRYDRMAQSLTFTHETLITYFCKLFNWDENNKSHRGAVDFTIQIKLNKVNKDEFNNENIKEWYLKNLDNALVKLDSYDNIFLENFIKIRDWRNTINHAKQGDRIKIQNEFPLILEKIDAELK